MAIWESLIEGVSQFNILHDCVILNFKVEIYFMDPLAMELNFLYTRICVYMHQA